MKHLNIKYDAFINWSSGKDAAFAFYKTLNMYNIKLMHTTINAETNRVNFHGVELHLLQKQAHSIGKKLFVTSIPSSCSNKVYENAVLNTYQIFYKKKLLIGINGDIFLDDLIGYKNSIALKANIKMEYPLYRKKSKALLLEMIESGISSIIVSVDASKIPKYFVGKKLDKYLINDLPDSIDCCGENGEYHTFCYNAPYFKYSINIYVKSIVKKSYINNQSEHKFYFADII